MQQGEIHRWRIVTMICGVTAVVGLVTAVVIVASEVRIADFRVNFTGNPTLEFTADLDSYYILLQGDRVTNIALAIDLELGSESIALLFDPIPIDNQERAFYRIQQVPIDEPLDSDIDGIDDVFELRHPLFLDPLDPSDAQLDFDGDGISNFDEYIAGTDAGAISLPFKFRITGLSLTEEDGVFVEHTSRNQSYYILYRGTSVTAILTAVDVQLGQETTGTLRDKDPSGNILSLYYRARQVEQNLPLDSDGDGIDDVYELNRIGFLNPLNNFDALEDFDNDGRSNLQEYQENTDPSEFEVVLTKIISSPFDGEVDVAVTRETILQFSNPISDSAQINSNNLFATFGGKRLATHIAVSANRKKATLFYNNPLPGSARIRVTFDGNTVNDKFNQSIDADNDGVAGGIATIDFDTLNLTPASNTFICGRVFASTLVPAISGGTNAFVNEGLGGVTISVDGLEDQVRTITETNGNFRLEGVPLGSFFVHIDGRTVTNIPAGIRFPDLSYYPNVGKQWTFNPEPGMQEVNVGEIYLPLIPPNTLKEISPTEDTVLAFDKDFIAKNPQFEGVSITVPPGTVFNNDGTPGTMIGIAPVQPDRLPGQLPLGLGIQDVITVQTDGASNFDTPIPACFPNLPDPITGEKLAPGEKSALWDFNHDTGKWEINGSMTVSADGKLVCTDPGVGIPAPGWHGTQPGAQGGGGSPGNAPSSPPPSNGCNPAVEDCDGQCGDDTNPVLLYSGEKIESVTDLRIKGVGMDFVWARTYGSKNGPDSVQGNGWDFSYNIHLVQEGSGVRFCNGAWRDDLYRPIPGQTGLYRRFGFFQELSLAEEGMHTMKMADQKLQRFFPFDGSPKAGKIESMTDRNGNRMRFSYDLLGRLTRVIDTLNRSIIVVYNSEGFVSTVTDFAGRTVKYQYYGNNEPGGNFGDLKSVTTPIVVGTPNGNDFPNGKTTTYTYSKGFKDERRNHNLLTITDGRRNDPNDPTFGQTPYLINVYSSTTNSKDPSYDRVIRQIRGGDVVDLTYAPQTPNPDNNQAVIKVITNDRVGNITEHFYDVGNRLVRILEYTGRADPILPTTETDNRPSEKLRLNDPDFFETTYEYNSDYLQTRIIHPNGNITENVYEADLNPNASPHSRGNLRTVRRLPGSHTPAGNQIIIEEHYEYDSDFGCGRCSFNFVTKHTDGRGNITTSNYDDHGNLVKRTHRIPSIVEDFEYNSRGQKIKHVHPDNGSDWRRTDVMTYYEMGPQSGYLKAEIIDAENLALTTTYEYDLVGNVTRKEDPHGDESLYVVNSLDQVVREFSPEVFPGSGIRYEKDIFYDANNNTIRIDIQNKDENGTLLSNTHFNQTFEYELLNFLIRETEEVEENHIIVTEYEYDENRNHILTRFGEATNGNQPNNTVAMVYDERDLLFQEVRSPGDDSQSTKQFDYDPNRNLITKLEGIEAGFDRPAIFPDYGAPRRTDYIYDGYDRLAEVIDPMGNTTSYSYDENHNRIHEIIHGENEDLPLQSKNIRLSETVNFYDNMDRLTREETEFFDTLTQDPVGSGVAIQSTEYSDNSQVVRFVNDNNHATETVFDTANRQSIVTDAKGNSISYEYDEDSNLISVVEIEKSDLGKPNQRFVTQFEYDGLDRLIQTTDSASNIKEYLYDSRGNRVVTLDAKSNIVRYVYDGLNRLTDTIQLITDTGDGEGEIIDEIITTQEWDDSSRLVAQIDDNGNATQYTYDPLNRRTTINYADGTTELKQYDIFDNVVRTEDPNGSVILQTYDLLNRRIGVTITPGEGVSDDTTFETYKYDGLSRLTHAEDNDSLIKREYNSLSRMTKEVLNGQTTSSAYDGVGNLIECKYPGGRTLTYAYDELERKRVISDQDGLIAEYHYIGPHRVEQRTYGNATRCEYEYDGIQEMANPDGDFGVKKIIRTTHRNTIDNTILDERIYSWDQEYNKIKHQNVDSIEPVLTHHYAYDSVYRLRNAQVTGVNSSMIRNTQYQLDGVGNRTAVVGTPNPGTYTLEQTTPEPADFQANQYSTTPLDTREYDQNGNLVGISQSPVTNHQSLSYDYRNQMVEYIDPGNDIAATYAYDALGRRISKLITDNGSPATNHYFYNDWQVCEEQSGDNTTLATYVYGNFVDEVLNMERANTDYYYHADDLNNVTVLSDSSGSAVERYRYDDYGNVSFFDAVSNLIIPQSQIANPYLFNGRRYDSESGLYYYRTRYLSPIVGRFITRDTIGVWEDKVNLGNGYAYVGNNPVTYMDPYGLACSGQCRELFPKKITACEISSISVSGDCPPEPILKNGICDELKKKPPAKYPVGKCTGPGCACKNWVTSNFDSAETIPINPVSFCWRLVVKVDCDAWGASKCTIKGGKVKIKWQGKEKKGDCAC